MLASMTAPTALEATATQLNTMWQVATRALALMLQEMATRSLQAAHRR